MRGSILFVCAANVCRSPLMQYTFLDSVADSEQWAVSSAGVSAREHAATCELGRAFVRSEPLRAAASAHRATPVDGAQLRADLIIVPSRSERAALARRAPDARWRLFTLSEAVLLGRHAAAHRLHETALRAPEESRPGAVAQYAEMLDAHRGSLVIPRPRKQRRVLSRREAPHPLDIPDAHHRRRHAHAAVLRRVRAETAEFAAQLDGFRDAPVR
ncbi:hypothetical protein [Leucobacter triazinivorans]|uniref:Phosphotyrosine protein phosphatase I domain-containing protein n=1 Tax=Leucobacter triazinivorans TaxID=1784719 RepID=A0A4P6KHT1_9MICO|nr:hypothetical protein [Leucobacter triazinivorans]QBE49124.1 hypothetical protein EVS81_09930 [Leucobacter triazinivorans]